MQSEPFGGRIGRTWRDSEPWWPPDPAPPAGAPNVVMIVLDDVGFAQLGCYGSEVETPVLDGLAAGGVQLANFHTTALCSPTRACLLTGRNHHTNGMGRIADLAIGFPGYSGHIPRANGFLSEILATYGYVPVAVGKWHLTPEEDTHQSASRSSWPCGRGFQRWYGFHGGETHQFVPSLFQDNHSVRPPASPEEGYHLSEDLAERAVTYLSEIRSATPDAPFFLYLATGACHSPHQAPREWIDYYAGRFDSGWDSLRERVFARQMELGLFPAGTRLSPRPHWVPAWDSLAAEDQRVVARFMECFAGFLSHADAQIGRVLSFIQRIGEWDNTLVVAVSDNGASAEGGPIGSINDVRLWNVAPADATELRARIDELGTPSTHNNYPWGWTMAGNTPFRRWKREVHQGGVADPCIFSWPARIPAGTGPRRQFGHAIDVVPTILELIGASAPAAIDGVQQSPIEGVSLAPVLTDPEAPEAHTVQYFEMFGSRGIYKDGWKAVTFHPFVDLYQEGRNPDQSYDDDIWELYHVAVDPSETEDLARVEKDRLATMIDLWWKEAEKYNVLPLDHRLIEALMDPRRTPVSRARHVFFPGGAIVPEYRVTPLRGRAHAIAADVVIPETGADGVLVAMGTVLGGWSFQVLGGRLRYVNNFVGAALDIIEAAEPLTSGRHALGFVFTPSPGRPAGTGALLVDGREVASGPIDRLPISRYNLTGGGLTCGWEQGPAVGPGYQAPFPWGGRLEAVVIETDQDGADPARAVLADLDAILAEQ
ncbi:MAG TPA: arylsulfatase [Acidimicrobiales bacterium]|jgi:arylsulfatase|nr:arylsulfatase [Acidimicrobiales bacterium]